MVPLLLRSRALICLWFLFHDSGSAVKTHKRYVRNAFALKDIPSQSWRNGDKITESPSEVPEPLPETEVTEPPQTVECRGTEDGVSESGWEPVVSELSLESIATEEYLLGPLLNASGVDFCANETVNDKFRYQHFRQLPQPRANSATQWEVNCCLTPQEQNMTYFYESPTDSPTPLEILEIDSENRTESPSEFPMLPDIIGSENTTESSTVIDSEDPNESTLDLATTEDLEGDVGAGFVAFLVILVVGLFVLVFGLMMCSP